MFAIFYVIDLILSFYIWIIIASAVFSWLFAFRVVNPSNQFVSAIGNALYQLTEPALGPIRRILPNLGQIDISPVVLIFAIIFIRVFLATSVAPMFGVRI